MASGSSARTRSQTEALWRQNKQQAGGTATTAASPATPSPPSTSRSGTSRASCSAPASSTCSAARSTRSCRRSPRATPTTSRSRRWSRRPQEWVAPGLHGVKVGFGKRGNARLGYEHDRDVEYIKAMREGLGPTSMIMIDCGWNVKWDVTDAVRRVQAFEEYDLHWIEEPLGAWDPEGYAQPARQDDDAHRLWREGVGPRGVRARARHGHRRRGRHRSGPRRGHHRLQEGHRALRVLPPPGERPCLVERDRHGREPGHQLQHAVVPSCSSSSRCATRCSTTS